MMRAVRGHPGMIIETKAERQAREASDAALPPWLDRVHEPEDHSAWHAERAAKQAEKRAIVRELREAKEATRESERALRAKRKAEALEARKPHIIAQAEPQAVAHLRAIGRPDLADILGKKNDG